MSTKPKGKTLADFQQAHDKSFYVPQRIRAALESLGESWEYEVEFLRRVGVSTTDFARFRGAFTDDFCIEVGGKNPKRVWAGTKAFATKLREAANG